MHLYLTNRSHMNSAYVDDSGRVMYKVQTPNKIFHRVATIKRVLPGDLYSSSEASTSNRRSSGEATNDNDPVKSNIEYDDVPDEHVDSEQYNTQETEGGNVQVTECRFGDFGHLAEITFHPIAPSILRFGGQEHESTQFFTKKAFGCYGRNRAFTGPDGIKYEWTLGLKPSELVRIDSERHTTSIARFHRLRLGIFTKRCPASLEIFPEGMHMVDLIVITFVYIQKIRNDNEKDHRTY